MNEVITLINEHYKAIIQKDIGNICNKYVPDATTYVVLEGPRLTTTGFDKIQKGWTDFCNSSLSLLSIEWIEGPFTDQHETMSWVAGIIRLKIKVQEKEFENIFRSSFVLVKHEGNFKIKHEHVSIVHPDPYGIGDWLQTKK